MAGQRGEAWHSQWDEWEKKNTAKNTLSSKAVIQNRRRDKEIPRQKKKKQTKNKKQTKQKQKLKGAHDH